MPMPDPNTSLANTRILTSSSKNVIQKHQNVYLIASKVEKRREEVGGNIRGHTVPLIVSQEFMAEDHEYSMADKRTLGIWLANHGKEIIRNPAQKGLL